MNPNEIGTQVIRAATQVHRHLGPGLLESAYLFCMFHELIDRGVKTESEVHLPIHYKGETIERGYRLDLWLERKVIIELKAVDEIHPIHQAQLLTYLKLTDNRLGYLINFNSERVKDGTHRMVNGMES